MISIDTCSICQGKSFIPYLTCIDHTVSHETFNLIQCQDCSFVITSPRPSDLELGKYYLSEEYISHTKKSKSIFDKLYRFTRQYTLQWKTTVIKNHITKNTQQRLLDFGCGTGEFLKKCKHAGFEIQGVEPSDIARQNAELLLGESIFKTIEQLNQTFNVVTLWHVLEHVPDLNNVIRQLKAKLKQNGTMFIAVPNHQSKDAEFYKEMWAGYDVPRHLWHFSKPTMKQFLNNHELKIIEIIPMKLDAFYVSMLSEKYLTGTNGPIQMIKGIIGGLKSNMEGKTTSQYSSLIYVVRK